MPVLRLPERILPEDERKFPDNEDRTCEIAEGKSGSVDLAYKFTTMPTSTEPLSTSISEAPMKPDANQRIIRISSGSVTAGVQVYRPTADWAYTFVHLFAKTDFVVILLFFACSILSRGEGIHVTEIMHPDKTSINTCHSNVNIDFSGFTVMLDRDTGPIFSTTSMNPEWTNLQIGDAFSLVNAIVIYNGEIYVGGNFLDGGGVPEADSIARWDGCAWHAVGQGFNHVVHALLVQNSTLYAGGIFTDANGDPDADYLAVWNGSSWSPVATGLNISLFCMVIAHQ